ncbi:MAG: hypothetical protein WCA85_04595 [Paraburkholderia sp.]|uniref:hypothetical protein n=1 Tax=Paraburkholderia sp. TaxID=1926495 RepID=UPI003C4DA819
MHELMRRTGAANPNQFAQWFDDATASWTWEDPQDRRPDKKTKQLTATKEQKKWYRIVRGQQALSEKALGQLARLFPDVYHYFAKGPDRLFEALWGPIQGLWDICENTTYDTPFWPNCDPDSGVTLVGKTYTGPSLNFAESLYNFERGLLLRPYDDFDKELDLFDLSCAIAMYRLHQAANSIAKTDGVGAYRCVRLCMDVVALWDQFDAFNTFSSFCVYEAINRELTEAEIRRLKGEPSYRESVGVSVGDIERYANWPRTFYSDRQRMEILQIDLPPRYRSLQTWPTAGKYVNQSQ